MISITCTHCKTVLTIDEAFAGGVCRCQHCGTIQTVPSSLKPASNYSTPAPSVSKALYQNQSSARGGNTAANTASAGSNSPSGLDQLAQIVASSGLSSSGLSSPRLNTADPVAPVQKINTPWAQPVPEDLNQPRERKKPPILAILIGLAVVLALAAGIVYFVFFNGRSDSKLNGDAGEAAFGGVPITGAKVVYVIDRANSLRDEFDPLKAAMYQSITSLGADRKFAVILWNNDSEDVAFPSEGLRSATADQVDLLKKKIQDVTATGSSHLGTTLEHALAREPNSIIIVTGKPSFENEDQASLNSALDAAGGKVKFYTFAIGSAGDNNVLKMTSKATGGQYRLMTDKDLRALTQ